MELTTENTSRGDRIGHPAAVTSLKTPRCDLLAPLGWFGKLPDGQVGKQCEELGKTVTLRGHRSGLDSLLSV